MDNPGHQNVFNPSDNPRHLPNATAVLVLGIISIIGTCCYGIVGIICGIIAMVLSGKDTRLYNANPGLYTLSSYNNMKAGRICAIIGLVLSSLYILAVIAFLSMFGMEIFTNPQEVLQNYR